MAGRFLSVVSAARTRTVGRSLVRKMSTGEVELSGDFHVFFWIGPVIPILHDTSFFVRVARGRCPVVRDPGDPEGRRRACGTGGAQPSTEEKRYERSFLEVKT